MTKAEIEILTQYLLPASPLTKDISPVMQSLAKRGLLSIRPINRHMARVQTTDIGATLLRGKKG